MNNILFRTYKIEMTKLIKRKDTLMLWLMPLLSLFYAIGIAVNSTLITYNGTEMVDALSFVSSMAALIHGLFIFYIIFAIISARSLGSEIEDKSILFYIPRTRSRNTIYNAKWLSLITVLTVSFAVFIIISIVAYFTLVVQRTDIANGLWYSHGALLKNISSLLTVFFCFVFTMLLVLVMTTRFKTIFSVCIFLFAFIALSFTAGFPIVQYISPFYYINEIGKDGANGGLLLLLSFILCALYSIIFNAIGKHTFSKRDL